jgi:predicted RNase H-like nuclease
MKFVGIDLAWSDKNCSGITVLDGDKKGLRVVSSDILLSDKEMIDYIREKVGKDEAIISIDAPLIVPNKKGRRLAEEVVGMLFRKYNAGAHPANRTRLSSWSGKIRGEDLTKLLEKEGFIHDPHVKKNEKTRKLMEVYPHPSIVVLFNLDMILKYKAKPKRDYEFRWREFEKYRDYLSKLPALRLPEELMKKNIRELRAKKLKNFEDVLDSIFCAYLSFYIWEHPEKCAVLGNMKKGYIVTPIFEHMKEKLEKVFYKKTYT